MDLRKESALDRGLILRGISLGVFCILLRDAVIGKWLFDRFVISPLYLKPLLTCYDAHSVVK